MFKQKVIYRLIPFLFRTIYICNNYKYKLPKVLNYKKVSNVITDTLIYNITLPS